MLPGTTFEQIINLSRSETDKEMKANIRLSGDKELLKWLKIENEKDLIMRKGQGILPMKVLVEVPKKAELKDYQGSIFVTLMPVESESLGGGQVAITLGANISVEISVTGQKILAHKINYIMANPLREEKPFSIRLSITNLGNVSISDIEGTVEIYDETQKNILKSFDFVPLDTSIAPDETKIVNMIFEDTVLEPGHYWAFVKAASGEDAFYENRLPVAVSEKVVPVVRPEDAMTDESLPKLPGEGEAEEETEETETVEIPVTEMRSAAPDVSGANSIFLVFGLAGLGFGLIALLGVIAVLIFVLKNQQKTVMPMGMPMQTPSAPPPPNPPVQNQPPQNPPVQNQMGYNANSANAGNANNTNMNAQNQQ